MKRLLVTYIAFCSCLWAISQSYVTNGNAVSLGGDCYRLTQASSYNLGTVWYSDAIDLTQPFDLRFEMNFGTIDAQGADGMVWVLQTLGTNALGSSGAGMGFGGFAQSFGVEFDTYSNNAVSDPAQNLQDPQFDHMAFLRNGNVNHVSPFNLAGPVQLSATSANVEDGQNHDVRIVWDPSQQLIQAYFDCQLRLQANLPLNTYFLNTPVYWGFTGSTGGLTNVQSVCLSPDIMVTTSEEDICIGESVTLGANLIGNNFTWSPNVNLSATNIQSPVASPIADQVYTVTYYDDCNFQKQEIVTVYVHELPVANAGNDVGLCPNGIVTLVSSGSPGSFLWTTSNGQITSSSTILSPTVVAPGDYVFTVTSQFGCVASDGVTVSSVIPPNLDLGLDQTICPGESVVYQVSSDWQTVTWFNGSQSYSLELSESATVSVIASYNGCSANDSAELVVVDLPIVNLGPDLENCSNEQTLLTSNVTGTWNNGIVANNLEVAVSGIYWCEVTQDGCLSRDSVVVIIDEFPVFSLPESLDLCVGDSYTITTEIPVIWNNELVDTEFLISDEPIVTATAENGVCINSQIVQISYTSPPVHPALDTLGLCEGQSIDYTLDVSSLDNVLWWNESDSPTIAVSEAGAYTVEIYNSCGSVSDTLVVNSQECEPHVYVPTAFTPDYDGVNDVWKIEATDLKWFSARVYNRWGDVIWEASSPDKVWLGDVHQGDHYAQVQVYTYTVDYISNYFTDVISLKGFVTVLR